METNLWSSFIRSFVTSRVRRFEIRVEKFRVQKSIRRERSDETNGRGR